MSKQSTRARLAAINFPTQESDRQATGQVLTEAFTKQHYKAIAEILKAHKDDPREVAASLAMMFKNDNPTFDTRRFLEAAGWQ